MMNQLFWYRIEPDHDCELQLVVSWMTPSAAAAHDLNNPTLIGPFSTEQYMLEHAMQNPQSPDELRAKMQVSLNRCIKQVALASGKRS